MKPAMFEREGHFWVSFVQNKETGRWISAANAKSAKYFFSVAEGVVVSGYIVSSKKGYCA